MRAARREPVEHTPIWFMRQAGRSLPEYREIREHHAFFEINRSAELTAEVTLQPVRRHGVDAAVMFADIMTPVVHQVHEDDVIGNVVALMLQARIHRVLVTNGRAIVGIVTTMDLIALLPALLARE